MHCTAQCKLQLLQIVCQSSRCNSVHYMKVRSHLMQRKLFCLTLVLHLKIVNLNAEI